MTYKFTTIIIQKGKWFIARCIELGVVSQGESIESAQKTSKKQLNFIFSGN